jgi:hypothetical protein
MSTAEVLLEVLKYVAPAGLVLGAVALVLREQRGRKESADRHRIYQKTFAHLVPLRLQAYERLIIYVERIGLESLLTRVDPQGKNVRIFQQQLTAEVREEYSHNIAQQLYIKSETWEEVATAKERVIALINQVAKTLPPDAPAIELARRMLNEMVKADTTPTLAAHTALKQDVQAMFRF